MRDDAVPKHMQRRLVGHEQGPGKVVRFRFDSAVTRAFSGLGEGRRSLVAEKAVRELVADIATLAVEVMGVVVHDGRLYAAGNRHGGEFRFFSTKLSVRNRPKTGRLVRRLLMSASRQDSACRRESLRGWRSRSHECLRSADRNRI